MNLNESQPHLQSSSSPVISNESTLTAATPANVSSTASIGSGDLGEATGLQTAHLNRNASLDECQNPNALPMTSPPVGSIPMASPPVPWGDQMSSIHHGFVLNCIVFAEINQTTSVT